jgi:hypothetical protein
MFHEGGCVHLFAKRFNLIGRLLGIVALGQSVPIHSQEKCRLAYFAILVLKATEKEKPRRSGA